MRKGDLMIGQSGIAVKHVSRADAASVAELAKHGVATIHEAMGRGGLLHSYMRPIYPGAAACGTAVTTFSHPGDNWRLDCPRKILKPRADDDAGGYSGNNDRHVSGL